MIRNPQTPILVIKTPMLDPEQRFTRKAYEVQDNMTVLEEAIDWVIAERVDVVLTGLLLGVSLRVSQ